MQRKKLNAGKSSLVFLVSLYFLLFHFIGSANAADLIISSRVVNENVGNPLLTSASISKDGTFRAYVAQYGGVMVSVDHGVHFVRKTFESGVNNTQVAFSNDGSKLLVSYSQSAANPDQRSLILSEDFVKLGEMLMCQEI